MFYAPRVILINIKNIKIKKIDKIKLSKNDYIYHAGTKILNGEILSNGGRVLNITSTGNNYAIIRKKIFLFLIKLIGSKDFTEKI